MKNKTAFGQFIQKKRKERQLTQREFAEKLYVTESAVSKWERGISYPDITLVTPICEALGITEHELVTASDDHRQHHIERQAKIFSNMVFSWNLIWYLLYAIAIVTCFIVNLAVFGTLSWFWIVLTSVALSFTLTSLPILVKKHRGGITLAAFIVTLILLLLTVNLFVGGSFWFFVAAVPVLFGMCVVFLPIMLRSLPLPTPLCNHKALICVAVDSILLIGMLAVIFAFLGNMSAFADIVLPITAASLPLPFLALVFWRYLKANVMLRTGLTLLLSALYTYFMNPFVDMVIEGGAFQLPTFAQNTGTDNFVNGIVVVSLLAAGLISICAGAGLAARNSRKHR
jgi:transcriptional regulator with XRE-family HTH domain